MTRIFKRIIFLICVLAPVGASAQEFPFPAGAQGDVAAVEKAMPAFADQLLATYKEENRVKYLDNLFRLQIVGGHYTEALQSLVALDEASADADSAGYRIVDRIFVRAKIIEASEHAPFAEAFRGAFRRQFDIIDYPTSALVIRQLTVPLKSRRADFENAVARQKDKNTISLADALSLIRAYQLAEMFGAIAPFTGALIDEDDTRRYITEKNIQVKNAWRHRLRPRNATSKHRTAAGVIGIHNV